MSIIYLEFAFLIVSLFSFSLHFYLLFLNILSFTFCVLFKIFHTLPDNTHNRLLVLNIGRSPPTDMHLHLNTLPIDNTNKNTTQILQKCLKIQIRIQHKFCRNAKNTNMNTVTNTKENIFNASSLFANSEVSTLEFQMQMRQQLQRRQTLEMRTYTNTNMKIQIQTQRRKRC